MERRPSGWYSGERTAGCRARTWDLSLALSNSMVAALQSVIPVSSKMKWASEECSNRTRKRSAVRASSGCGVMRLAPPGWGPVCKRVAYDEPSLLLPRESIRFGTCSEPGGEVVDGLESQFLVELDSHGVAHQARNCWYCEFPRLTAWINRSKNTTNQATNRLLNSRRMKAT